MEITITPLPDSTIGAVVGGMKSAAALARVLDKGDEESERIAARLADAMRDHLLLLIRGEDGVDHYFHANESTGTPFDQLRVGDAVTFRPDAGEKGPMARSVHRRRA